MKVANVPQSWCFMQRLSADTAEAAQRAARRSAGPAQVASETRVEEASCEEIRGDSHAAGGVRTPDGDQAPQGEAEQIAQATGRRSLFRHGSRCCLGATT